MLQGVRSRVGEKYSEPLMGAGVVARKVKVVCVPCPCLCLNVFLLVSGREQHLSLAAKWTEEGTRTLEELLVALGRNICTVTRPGA